MKILKTISWKLVIIVTIFVLKTNYIKSDWNCENQILDEDKVFSSYEHKDLCEYIKNNNKSFFIIRIVRDLERYNDRGYEYKYDEDNEKFADFHAKKVGINPWNVIVITVYNEARKIRLSVGNNHTYLIDTRSRERVIETMKNQLKNKEYYKAFNYGLMELVVNLNKGHSNDYQRQSGEKNEGGWSIWVYVIIIFAILAFIGWMIDTKSKKIHEHYEKLSHLIKNEIYKKDPPICSTPNCLLCFKNLSNINKYGEDKGVVKQFSCGHFFHQNCIGSMETKGDADMYCMMCDEPTGVVRVIETVEELDGTQMIQHVTEKNVVNIINNFSNIYGKENLKTYYKEYNNSDIKVINSFSSPVWWISNPEYIPAEPKTYSKNNSGNYETSGGTWSSSSRKSSSSSNYKTSGGSY